MSPVPETFSCGGYLVNVGEGKNPGDGSLETQS